MKPSQIAWLITIFLAIAVIMLLLIALPEAHGQTCGGPTYPCSLHQTSTQLTVIPTPPTPPMGNLRGAGTTVAIAPYSTNQIRCTDAGTDPTNVPDPKHPHLTSSYEVTDTGGDNVYQWNADQTMLRVVRMGTGTTGVVGFNGTVCTPMNPYSIAPAGAQWSLNNPTTDYYENGMTQIVKRVFDPSNPLLPPTITNLFDFASCVLLNSLGKVTYNTQIVTNDDNVFYMAFGVSGQGQDTSQYIVGYRLDTHICVIFNTITGQVQQAGGIPDIITLATPTNFFPFTIHSMYLAPAGQLLIGIGKTCTGCPIKHGGYFWYPATAHLDMIPAGGGHSTSGYNEFVFVTAAPRLSYRLFTDLANSVAINPSSFIFPPPQDVHMGWQNNPGNDSVPVCMSQMTSNLSQPPTPSVPLQLEIYCVDPTNGSYIRIAPTFTSGLGPNFRTQYAIMANGKKGYIAHSSDWEGTLGNIDGITPTCTLGTTGATACRSDVFIDIAR
jgi:hypothetical protein